MGKVVLYLSLIGAGLFLLYEIVFKKKDLPIGDAMKLGADSALSDIRKKLEEEKERRKKKPRWFLWIGSIVSILGTAGAGWWFLGRKPTGKGDGLYQLGYLGQPAPAGAETSAAYLSGMMKRRRDDQWHEIASQGSKTIAGLPIKGLTANFGKVYQSNENYSKNSQWPRKF